MVILRNKHPLVHKGTCAPQQAQLGSRDMDIVLRTKSRQALGLTTGGRALKFTAPVQAEWPAEGGSRG